MKYCLTIEEEIKTIESMLDRFFPWIDEHRDDYAAGEQIMKLIERLKELKKHKSDI